MIRIESWICFQLKHRSRQVNLGTLLLPILFLTFGCSATMAPSMERWSGKIAVVTGASAGIGASIAEHLVEHGVKVIGLARRVERIEALADKLKTKKGSLHGMKVDVTQTKQITDAFKKIDEEYGPVSIMVNNAGVFEDTTLCDGDVEKWRKTFEINVIALCTATREAVRSMKKHKINGHIIHINSVAGHRPIGYVGENVYPASKYAVTALTESLRIELKADTKIKVTSISPGLVRSTEIFQASGAEIQEINDTELENAALNPEDVSHAVVYALSTPPHVQVHELMLKPIGSDV
ncbi:farnesol dehydrogenase-like [Coccinella septempunctata]|uniref:farnesol dehydrogenase-like n=1 Tax=Coccinella septempunctata TaxID=41139 RepID=UPI001D063475|nr:farnesol dehydrogenase-like [Coccinella septempunctata]